MTTIKLNPAKFEKLVSDNAKDIQKYTDLLTDKKRIKEVYGFEENGEEISRYENLLSTALEIKREIDNGKYIY